MFETELILMHLYRMQQEVSGCLHISTGNYKKKQFKKMKAESGIL